ncbi:hypothetical protein ACWIUD_05540 [Helicobacter sp. 23-1044]
MRKKTSESNTENSENLADSQNLNRDSSLVSLAQNDNFNMDCHDSAFAESRNDGFFCTRFCDSHKNRRI